MQEGEHEIGAGTPARKSFLATMSNPQSSRKHSGDSQPSDASMRFFQSKEPTRSRPSVLTDGCVLCQKENSKRVTSVSILRLTPSSQWEKATLILNSSVSAQLNGMVRTVAESRRSGFVVRSLRALLCHCQRSLSRLVRRKSISCISKKETTLPPHSKLRNGKAYSGSAWRTGQRRITVWYS